MRRLPPLDQPWILLDDARTGGTARLFTDARRIVTATSPTGVREALSAIRDDPGEWAGFLSYEAASAFEPSLAAPAALDAPLAWFAQFGSVETIADVAALLPDRAAGWIGAPRPAIRRHAYRTMFDAVQALIEAGDLYQANLTFPLTARVAGDPLALYARLRSATRAGWSAIVATGDDLFLSFSPELFFDLSGGRITCRPMKGTARRQPDPVADRAAATALAGDPKQRAENLMIVDLMRNDVSRVATPGSVRVPALFAVEPYPTVHQLTSTVTATIAPGRDAIEVLGALFPCGSITGAPKLRAIEALAEIEGGRPRGLYTGAIGRIDAEGGAQFSVAIRTLRLADGVATIGVGGGIVADSTADGEWDEALAKAAFLTHEGPMADLIETMRFDPVEGIALLDRHLARMRDSAHALGFSFDRHAARNELQAATFRLRTGAKVRLLLAASGAVAIEVAPLPPAPAAPLRVAIVPRPVGGEDWRLRHKSSDRAFYDDARIASGADEVIFADAGGRLTEGSFTSLFVPRGGALVTPGGGDLLHGVLRGALIDEGHAIEGDLAAGDLRDGFFVGNAVRGLMPAVLA